MDTSITCVSAQGARRTLPIADLLDHTRREQVAVETAEWIKRLRLVPYDGGTMRERFRYGDASLWWFTELYLHKTRRLETAVRTILAIETALADGGVVGLELSAASPEAQASARAFGQSRGIAVSCVDPQPVRSLGWWPSYRIGLTTRLSRLRPVRRKRIEPTRVAAFVHTAFWRAGAGGADPALAEQESYIGPVLAAVADRIGRQELACVGLGPRRNFRARRWWDPLLAPGAARRVAIPIERLAPMPAVQSSLAFWKRRGELARAVVAGDGIRAAATFRGCDLWDVLSAELTDVARLQWPWSARAMDEAGAALDTLRPDVVVTYAEAGGWGRALILEARRRGVPSVGLQHGFIYRHWLNYLHEPDEIEAVGSDRGFPYPDRTLLFDAHAARHLSILGHLPIATLRVTGSPKRDALVATHLRLQAESRDEIRSEYGAGSTDRLLVLAAKFTEIRHELPELFAAVAALPSVRLVVKPHPAETVAPYLALAGGAGTITVSRPDADLARLLAAADALVTRNSTVAIDALVVGLPALVVGLPSNLSPFVEAGVMAGAPEGSVRQAVESLLYDQDARAVLLERARQFASAGEMPSDGQAAARAADEIVALTA